MPWLAVDAALIGEDRQIGGLHALHLPPLIKAMAGIITLDLSIYMQHRLMHRLPLLWRLHRVHHTDASLDVSSATRFHPAEIALSMVWKIGVVLAFGIAPVAVLSFEILLSSFALFTHANVSIPERWECVIRTVFVTPEMHRIHHSIEHEEHRRNFCFHLSLWDRVFGTYCATPIEPPRSMKLGLTGLGYPAEQTLLRLLLMPLKREG